MIWTQNDREIIIFTVTKIKYVREIIIPFRNCFNAIRRLYVPDVSLKLTFLSAQTAESVRSKLVRAVTA